MDTITVKLSGQCKNIEDNKSIAYAFIKLSRSDTLVYVTLSDEDGNFKFNHLRAGRYKIEVVAFARNTIDTTVTFAPGEMWKLEVGLSMWSQEMRRRITF